MFIWRLHLHFLSHNWMPLNLPTHGSQDNSTVVFPGQWLGTCSHPEALVFFVFVPPAQALVMRQSCSYSSLSHSSPHPQTILPGLLSGRNGLEGQRNRTVSSCRPCSWRMLSPAFTWPECCCWAPPPGSQRGLALAGRVGCHQAPCGSSLRSHCRYLH